MDREDREDVERRLRAEAADAESYAAHVKDAQQKGDVDPTAHFELAFASWDTALYSFCSDVAGVSVRRTAPGSSEVNYIWIPSDLFGVLQRALAASRAAPQERSR